MKYYQIAKDGEVHLCLKTSDGALFNLSELEPSIKSFLDLLILADDAHSSIDELASKVIVGKHIERNIMEISHVLKPINPPEVWAAGVTYKRSEQERRLESDTPDVYSKVYASDRPELFFKGEIGRFRVIAARVAAVPTAAAAIVINSRLLSSRAAFSDLSVMAPS